jgi:L-threonylcarbamoyladenylate synthase
LIKTRVIKTQKAGLSPDDLAICVESLKMGGVIVFPTDTVYGIGCNAFHPEAIRKIYEIKGRDYVKPLPILLGDPAQLSLVAKEMPKEATPLMKAFWPGALTLVFKTAPLALGAARGKQTVAIRVPDHGVAVQLLAGLALPLAATSANLSGHKAIASGAQAKKLFDGQVDLIIDGGDCAVGRESSVVDASHYPFTLLREGAIAKPELLAKIGVV